MSGMAGTTAYREASIDHGMCAMGSTAAMLAQSALPKGVSIPVASKADSSTSLVKVGTP